MNDRGIKSGIRQRIASLPKDAVFSATDFTDIGDSDSIRRVFKEMADEGHIVRVRRGVYYKPRFNAQLNRMVPSDADRVAEAIARARGWSIAPSGNHALNRIGLDSQVPAVYSYISTGPYTTIETEFFELRFKHSANKNLIGMSKTTLLVVQALKALGRENVGDAAIDHIAAHRLAAPSI